MEPMVELVLGTKRFERSTYLAMFQDPVVPLSLIHSNTPDTTPLANKNVTNFFCGIQLRFILSQ
ncbi:hypothetical protein N7489_000215 [Penicillium chrysogenum]|uniref:Uncharacterized protein n=1 Tax=Penicillium chrysogenum TaxID=5076 RepID=A0ABQ8WF83_PENCH|nr:uncharacterized protein N7489_000215 [Penicillium chrysogenum]KAJ5249805.1 hypothetical protein N7489_000215 [Penicillium chrysogenum]KAJ5265417.1 hypothetical protein N7524_006435 [Penicillium chrysogenum]KAJ5268709.1 hypothetical protein N7505_004467 [Penicillium chrysogenum]KAJ6148582.1 hypothetical protein N7497_010564 [Penicillium chrysogenum]